jgi:basic membrane lipoprotein Med (substrate-binding protein (PBP1-ABC) superfamily)
MVPEAAVEWRIAMASIRFLPRLVLVAVVVLGGTACAPAPPAEEPAFRVRLLTSATLSGRWERAAERGLGLIAAELDAEVARIRATGSAEQRLVLGQLAGDGIDLVFCVGPGAEPLVFTEAAAFPDTVFVVVPGEILGANIASVAFMPEEAGYLAGAVATAFADDGPAGVLRGPGRPWLERLEAGFAAGVQAESGGTEPLVAAGPEGPWQLVQAGVEVALYATDSPDRQVMAAVHDAGLLLVAADPWLLEDHPDVVVAAVEVDAAEALLRVAREVRDRTFVGRVFAFDLGSGVLDVVLNSDLAGLRGDDEVREVLERVRSEITAGWVEIEELGIGR